MINIVDAVLLSFTAKDDKDQTVNVANALFHGANGIHILCSRVDDLSSTIATSADRIARAIESEKS